MLRAILLLIHAALKSISEPYTCNTPHKYVLCLCVFVLYIRKITDVGQVPIKVDILKDCVTV